MNKDRRIKKILDPFYYLLNLNNFSN